MSDTEKEKPVVRRIKVTVPPEFKGSGESAERWFKRYEICVASNEWNEATKLSQVKPLMGGEALDFLLDLPDTDLQSYKTIKEKMIKEFDQKELRETYVKDFHSRSLNEGEELQTFMRALKVLARKAYPKFDEEHRDSLVDDRYRQEMPHQIQAVLPFLAVTPGNLDELLEQTDRLARGVHKGLRAVATVGEGTASSMSLSSGAKPSMGLAGCAGMGQVSNSALMDKLVELQEKMLQMGSSQQELEVRVNHLATGPRLVPRGASASAQYQESSGGGGRSLRNVVCYECREKGHMRRDCPNRSSNSASRGEFLPHVICSKCSNAGHYASSCKMKSGNA